MKRILVTWAGGSAAYNFIESLRNNPAGEKFYIVWTDTKRFHIELSDVDVAYQVPATTDPQYLQIIQDIISREKIEFIHSQPEQEVLFFSEHKKDLNAHIYFPSLETIHICQDKMRFNKILKDLDMAVPESYLVKSPESLKKSLKKILKSNEKAWVRAIRWAGSKWALPVTKFKQAKSWIEYWEDMKGLWYGDFMVSEFLPGKEYAFQSLWKDGELIMSQARERVEYLYGFLSPSWQSSTPSVAVTVHNDEINKTVEQVIKAIDPHATWVFCADLKTDKNGKIVLMEINVWRFFTTSYFFSAAGCNMPYYYVKMAYGEDINYNWPKFNCIPEGWYWVRMVDMGYKLIKNDEWKIQKIY